MLHSFAKPQAISSFGKRSCISFKTLTNHVQLIHWKISLFNRKPLHETDLYPKNQKPGGFVNAVDHLNMFIKMLLIASICSQTLAYPPVYQN